MRTVHALATGPIRGIVFDLWNTLVYNDHRPNPVIAIARSFDLLDRPGWTKVIERGMMRRPLPGIEEGIASLSRSLGVTLPAVEAEGLSRLWREACRKTRWFEEVPAILRSLSSRFRLGLLSNTQSFDLEFLEDGELRTLFHARLLSCDAGILKPDPALFHRMAGMLGMDPAEILMVGDNLRDDVLGSEAAGMQAVLIRRSEAPLSFQERHGDRIPITTLHPLLDLPGA
jgi:putative hydrolase of the HAD superfamily